MENKEFIETNDINIIKYFLEFGSNIESNVFVKVDGIKDKAEYGYIKITDNQTNAYIKPIFQNIPKEIENINQVSVNTDTDTDIENKSFDKIIKKSKSKNNNTRFKKKSKLRKKIFI